jgi:hypothetical protein
MNAIGESNLLPFVEQVISKAIQKENCGEKQLQFIVNSLLGKGVSEVYFHSQVWSKITSTANRWLGEVEPWMVSQVEDLDHLEERLRAVIRLENQIYPAIGGNLNNHLRRIRPAYQNLGSFSEELLQAHLLRISQGEEPVRSFGGKTPVILGFSNASLDSVKKMGFEAQKLPPRSEWGEALIWSWDEKRILLQRSPMGDLKIVKRRPV